MAAGGDEDELLYCIKWKGRSHLHNSWHTADELQAMDITGLKKLANYARAWAQQQAVLAHESMEMREHDGLQRTMLAQIRAQQRLVERVRCAFLLCCESAARGNLGLICQQNLEEIQRTA